jgi:pimeloyl-ACP methyl ester carboxylesterase
LILYAGSGGSAAESEDKREQRKAMATLARLGWSDPNSAFRQMFTSRFMPDATKDQAEAYNDLLLKCASPEGAARYLEAEGKIDARQLWSEVRVPTLVLRPRDDVMSSADGCRKMAQTIPGARYVSLEGRNHVFMPTEPAAERFFEEVELFLHT